MTSLQKSLILELDACKSFKQVVDNFLGKYKAESFVEIIENLLQPTND